MSGTARLGAFVGALVVVFALAFGAGRVVVPDGAAQRWNDRIETHDPGHNTGEVGHSGSAGHSGEEGHR